VTKRNERDNGRPVTPVPGRRPVSSYRLQFHREFTFDDAARLVPYLARLGVTECYASPYLMARPGSSHGYDVSDHRRLNPEVGDEASYEAFTGALAAHAMGQILDFVPNHMGIDPCANPWWHDVLENGPSSSFGRFFDIDWDPVKPELHGKVLLPILGDQYGRVLERGELTLAYHDGGLLIDYFDHRLPVNPRRAVLVYRHGLDELRAELGDDDRDLREFLSIVTALWNLPDRETAPERIDERQREKEVARERLVPLVEQSPRLRRHIEAAIAAYNGEPGRPESFDLLHELLEQQAYRLAYWRTALHEINYRRFFDINDLAGIRMEDEQVFQATHVLAAQLVAGGRLTGLRIDHPDGLYDPQRYFAMLQELADGGGEQPCPALYVIAEKILSAGECLPSDWAVYGTTGYSFANEVNGVFVDRDNAPRLRRIYARVTGLRAAFPDVVYACKKLITGTSLASELNVLAHKLNVISEGNRRSRDFTLNSLRDALQEVVACFPVYRTYVSPRGWSTEDRRTINVAVNRAMRRNPAVDSSIFDFLREVLLPRDPEAGPQDGEAGNDRRDGYAPRDEAEQRARLDFSMKFQQYTAPVQAKGLEDTAFYRYNMLVSLNEVGGDPGRVGRSAAEFHEVNAARLDRWPYEMLTTATHDTKLGEDVRARINVLSSVPDEWARVVSAWMRRNAGNRAVVEGQAAPDRNDEYRFYQVLLGAWPTELTREPSDARAPSEAAPVPLVDRIRTYLLKAVREAKVNTSWISDDKAYDDAVERFVERTLAGPTAPRFLASFLPFQYVVARLGAVNSLAQLTLKIGSPGVPDFYRGTELWDLNLVDPDNRRRVDYERRARLLDDLEPLLEGTDQAGGVPEGNRIAELLACWRDGRVKLLVTAAGLRLRRTRPDLFLSGAYLPLDATLDVGPEIVAFARLAAAQILIVVVPRFTARFNRHDAWPIGDLWAHSKLALPPALGALRYRNVFTGEVLEARTGNGVNGLRLADVLRRFPVAMLIAPV
jgi:(1->4)-alpha-D-glucan 1-alpha-D-glucosylmutase